MVAWRDNGDGKFMNQPMTTEIRFGMTLSGRQVLVFTADRPLTDFAHLDRLSMEVPDLAAPFNVGAGAGQFRNRRCRLEELAVRVDPVRALSYAIETRGRVPGLTVEQVVGTRSGVVAIGAVSTPSGKAPITVRFGIGTCRSEMLLSALEIRVYGRVGTPPGALVASYLASMAPAGTQRGAVELAFDPMDWVLWTVLLPAGWRLPDRPDRELALSWSKDGVTLSFRSLGRSDDGLAEPGEDSHGEDSASSRVRRDQLDEVMARGLAEYRTTEALLIEGRLDEAADAYVKVWEQDRADRFALLRAMELCSSLPRRRLEGQALAREALARWPDWIPALIALASTTEASGDRAGAAELYERIARLAEAEGRHYDVAAATLAGAKLWETIDQERAIAGYEAALEAAPDSVEASARLEALYRDRRDWSGVLRLFRDRIAAHPPTARVDDHVALGELYLEGLDDALRARAEFEKAVRIDSGRADAWIGLARAFLFGGDPARGLEALKRITSEATPTQTLAIDELWARCEDALGMTDVALARIRPILDDLEEASSSPTDPWSIVELAADLAARAEDWVLCARLLNRLGARGDADPKERVRFLMDLARVALDHLDDRTMAQRSVDEALALDKNRPELLSLAVTVAIRRGRLAEAVDLMERLSSIQADPQLMVQRARLLAFDLDRPEEALEDLTVLPVDSTEVIALRVDIFRALGRTEDLVAALERYLESVEVQPANAETIAGLHLEWADLIWKEEGAESVDKVKRSLVAASRLQPDNVQFLERLAGLLDGIGATMELEQVRGRLVILYRKSEDLDGLACALGAFGRVLLETGRPDRAVEALTEASRLRPDELSLEWTLAEARQATGQMDEALDLYLRLWESVDASIDRSSLAARIAEAYHQRGDRDAMVRFARQAVELGVEGDARRRSRQWVCDALVAQERWEEAVEAYQDMVGDEHCPIERADRARALYAAAEISRQYLSDPKRSESLCRAVLDVEPRHRGALNTLETLLTASNRWEDLLDVLERKIAAAEGHAQEQAALLGRLGRIEQEHLGWVESARRHFQRAMELDPRYEPALLFVARDAFRTHSWQESFDAYEGLDRLFGEQEDVSTALEGEVQGRLARLCFELGRLGEVDEHARRAIEAAPDDDETLSFYSDILEEDERWEELASILRRRVELASDPVGLRLALAEVLSDRLGMVSQAAEVCRELLRRRPDEPAALMRLASLLAREGRSAERLKVLGRLVRVLDDDDPGSVQARRELVDVAIELQQMDVARQQVEILIDEGGEDESLGRSVLVVAEALGDPSLMDRGFEALARVSDDPEQTTALMVRRARLHQDDLSDPSGALALLDEISDPTTEVLELRALCFEGLGQFRQAADVYGTLAEHAEEVQAEQEVTWRLKLMELAEGELSDSDLLEFNGLRLVELLPEDASVAGRMAEFYRDRGDGVMMRRMLEHQLRALRLVGDDQGQRSLMLRLARLWMQVQPDGLDRAETLCRRAMELGGGPDALQLLSEVMAARKDFRGAAGTIEELVGLLDKEQTDPELLGRYSLEVARLYAGLADGGQDCRLWGRKAAGLLKATARIEALDLWRSHAVTDAVWSEVAEAGEQLKQARGAVVDLEGLARAYEELGRVDEAIRVVQELVDRVPGDPRLTETVRRLYTTAGRLYDLAKNLENEARDKEDPALLVEAARSYLASPDGVEDARRCAEAAWKTGYRQALDVLDEAFSAPRERDRFWSVVAEDVLVDGDEQVDLFVELAQRRLEEVHHMDDQVEVWLLKAASVRPQVFGLLVDGFVTEARWDEAAGGLRRWLETDLDTSERAGVQMRLVRVLSGRLDRHEEAAELAGDIDRGALEERDLEDLAKVLFHAGRLLDAERLYGRLAGEGARRRDYLLAAADVAAARQDGEAEVRWLLDMVEELGGDEELCVRLVDRARQVDEQALSEALRVSLQQDLSDERAAAFEIELAELCEADERLALLLSASSRKGWDVSLQSKAAQAAIDAGNLERGIELLADLHDATSGDQGDIRGRLSEEMARAMETAGQDAVAACQLYRRAADEYADDAARRRTLSRIVDLAREIGDPGAEEEALRALLDDGRAEQADRLRLIDLSAGRGAWSEVLELCALVEEIGGLTAHQVMLRARAYEALGRWQEASVAWKNAAQRPDADQGAWLLRAAVVLRDRCDDMDGAVELLGEAALRQSVRAEAVSLAEAICRRQGWWSRLLEFKEMELRLGSDGRQRAKILHGMAVIRDKKLGDPDTAASLLAEAVAADGDFYPALRPLGEYHFRNKEWKPAHEYLTRALQDPDLDANARVEVFDRLASIARARDDVSEELEWLLSAVAVDASRTEMWQRAEESAKRGNDGRALSRVYLLQAQVSSGRQKGIYLARAARELDEMGDDGAVDLYEQAVDLNTDLFDARQRLLVFLRERSDWERLTKRLERELMLVEGAARAAVAGELASLCEGPLDDDESAERYCRLAYREDPTNAKWIWGVADFLARHRRWTDLVDFLELVLDTAGLDDTVVSGFMALLGRIYLEKLEDQDRALAVFQRARSHGVLSGRSVTLMADLYRGQERWGDLATLYEEMIQHTEENAIRSSLAVELSKVLAGPLGDMAASSIVLVSEFRRDPKGNISLGRMARDQLLELSAYEDALALSEELVGVSSDREHPGEDLACGVILAEYLGREEEAVEYLRRAVEAQVDLSRGHLILGRILLEQGQVEEALYHLDIVAEGERDDRTMAAEAHQLAGQAAARAGRGESAIRHWEAALAFDATNEGVLDALAEEYDRQKQWDRLDKVLARRIVIEPDPSRRARLWYKRALLLGDFLNSKSDALRCLKEAVAAAPGYMEAVRSLRQAEEDAGDFAAACHLLDREIAAATDPHAAADLQLHLGALLETKLHKPHAALAAYQQAARLAPDNHAAGEERARLFAVTGQWLKAAEAEETRARQEGSDEHLLKAAQYYLRGQDSVGATRCWTTVLAEGNGRNVEIAARALVRASRRAADRRDVLKGIQARLEDCEDSAVRLDLLRLIVKVLVEEDDLQGAEPYVAKILDDVPDDRWAFLYRRKIVERNGTPQELAALIEQRIAQADDDELSDLLFSLGGLQRDVFGQAARAADTFDRLISLDPDNRAAMDVRADLAHRLGDYRRAWELYEKLGVEDTSLSEVALSWRRGEIAEALGREEDARTQYLHVVQLDPKNRAAWEALVRLDLYSDRKEDAVEDLWQLVDLLPVGHQEVWTATRGLLVDLLIQLGRYEDAETQLSQLRQVVPGDVRVLRLGWKLNSALERWDRVVDILSDLVTLEEDAHKRASLLLLEAEIFSERLGRQEAAADCLLKAADLAPDHLDAWRGLAQYYSRTGRWEELVGVCQSLLEIEKDGVQQAGVKIRMATALLLAGGEQASEAPALLRQVDRDLWPVDQMCRILADMSVGLRETGFTTAPIGRVIDALSSSFGSEATDRIHRQVQICLEQRPGDVGARRLMLRLAPRVGQRWALAEHQKVLAYLDPEDPATKDLREGIGPGQLGAMSLDVAGPALPEGLRVPLRTVLERLSDLLAGFMRGSPDVPRGQEALSAVVSPLRAAKVASVVRQLKVRAVDIRVQQSDRILVGLVDARPPAVVVSSSLLDLPDAEFLFLIGRGLEWVRSGALFLKDRSWNEVDEIIVAVAQALGVSEIGGRKVRPELVEILSRWGVTPEALDRADLMAVTAALMAHLRSPCDMDEYRLDQVRMAQRVGLLVSGDLQASLRAAAIAASGMGILETNGVEDRSRVLDDRSELRELAFFGVSRLRWKLHRNTRIGY